MEVRSDRTHRFDAAPAEVWDAIARVDDYRHWWPWLRRFEAEGVEPGARWRCTVRPPLPYALRFTVELTDVVEGESIDATVDGDIGGEATVTIRRTAQGSEVRLISTLAPQNGLLRNVARWAPRLAHFGHDWVLDTGLRQFRHRAL